MNSYYRPPPDPTPKHNRVPLRVVAPIAGQVRAAQSSWKFKDEICEDRTPSRTFACWDYMFPEIGELSVPCHSCVGRTRALFQANHGALAANCSRVNFTAQKLEMPILAILQSWFSDLGEWDVQAVCKD